MIGVKNTYMIGTDIYIENYFIMKDIVKVKAKTI
jgi:hypothetical protein